MFELFRNVFAAIRRWRVLRLLETNPDELKTRLAVEAKAYFAAFGSTRGRSGVGMTAIGPIPMMVVDLTSAKEKWIAQEANSAISVGPAFDALVAELREIGWRYEFTIVSDNPLWGSSDYEGREHKRARAIGRILDAAGGMDLMQAAWYRVRATQAGAKGDARDLSRCWDGVGKWRY